ncbi:putative membrane protein [Escovopsis weberi]|uniref:Putative membrane protein n=1 Tax=Escovopsis weberi TaxID=150374 RepID=A0A0M8MUZ0_ESCWE|nr:putative membrane protein [Escovopsis weberi]
MASILAKTISKRILKESVTNKFGSEDPYFEQVPATRLDGRPTGKVKKRKKALPPGISEHDGKVLTKVKRRAYRLDMSLFNFLGIRFGWSSVLGLIPAAGDSLDAFMALMVFRTCCQVEGGLPNSLKFWMLMNIVVDFFIGLVPILGDLADALFRANTRNAMLLEKHLREKGQKELRKSGLPIPTVDPSSPEEFDRVQREDPPAYDSDSVTRNGETPAAPGPSRPQMARVRDAGFARLFGNNPPRPHDLEMGRDDAHRGKPSNSRPVESLRQKRGGRR